MSIATITSKGQITIPVDVRTGLGLEAGDRVNFVLDEDMGRVVILPVTKSVESLKGIIPKPNSPVTVEDMKATVKSKAGKK